MAHVIGVVATYDSGATNTQPSRRCSCAAQISRHRGEECTTVRSSHGMESSFWVTRLMESMLVDVTPHDPASYAIALITILVAAAAAAVIPALRAA